MAIVLIEELWFHHKQYDLALYALNLKVVSGILIEFALTFLHFRIPRPHKHKGE